MLFFDCCAVLALFMVEKVEIGLEGTKRIVFSCDPCMHATSSAVYPSGTAVSVQYEYSTEYIGQIQNRFEDHKHYLAMLSL